MFTSTTALTPSELKSAIVRDPLIVEPETTVMDAIAKMSGVRTLCETTKSTDRQLDALLLEARSSCVLVVEDDRLLGILTERDVVHLSAQQYALGNLPIREVMIHPVITLHESNFNDLFFAVNLLQQYRIRHIPILDDRDRVVGLLTNESLRHSSRPADLLRLRLVSEVMTREVICAVPNSSMLAIAQLMAKHSVSSVMIVQNRGNQAEPLQIPVGILTERDIVQFRALDLNLETCLAEAVMSTTIFAVKTEESLWTVQQIMEQRSIRRLAVTGERGELLGIVTQTSLLQALNPLELYKLAEVLKGKVVQLEAEKIELLETRTIELEREVEARTLSLKAKAEREKLVAAIATQIRSSLSLQMILDTTVEQVRQLLGCDRVNIWQCDRDGQVVVVAESTDSSPSLVGEQINDTCFKQEWVEMYRQGHIRVVPDIYTTEMSACHRDLLIHLQTRAKILVPLLCGDELWGLLNASESQHARAWQPEEIELLQALSVQLAIAIQQATTHQQLQEQLIERQQVEVRLRESEQRYITLTAAAPVGIFRTDAEGKSIYSNQRCCEMLGLLPEETTGSGWQQAIHPDDRARVIAETILARQENRPFQLEYRILRPDGTTIWVLGQAVAERDDDGQAIGYVGTITDISERKQAEEALQQLNQDLEVQVAQRTAALQASQATNRTMLEAIPDLLLRLRRDGTCLDYIKPGINAENFLPINNHISEVLPPDLLQKQLQAIEQAIVTRELQVYEHQFLKQDRNIYEEIRVLAINDQEVLAIVRDISDRKRTEKALKQQLAAIEAAIDGIGILQGDTYLYLNKAHLNLFGYERPEELVGKSWRFLYSQKELERFEQEIFPALGRDLAWQGEAIATRKDGTTFTQGLSLTLTDDGLLICVCRDISAQKQVKAQLQSMNEQLMLSHDELAHSITNLQRSNALLTAQQEASFDGILVIDENRQVVAYNQRFLNLWNVPETLVSMGDDRQLIPFALKQLSQPTEFLQKVQYLYDRPQEISHDEISLLDGRTFDRYSAPIYSANEHYGRVWFFRDISDRKRAEAQLQASNEQLAITNLELARANRLKDEFLANMSHELRTPLNAILGMAEGLQEEVFGAINERQIKALQTVERSGSHLLELIDDILDVAKIEAGQITLDCTPTSIAYLCQSSLAFIKQQALRKNIQIEVKLPLDLPDLSIDERRIRQVLLNLLNNAVKFTPRGGRITLEASLKQRPTDPNAVDSPPENYVRIAIIDTGIGIASENITKLFQPFVQIDSALNRQYAGTGLGLVLVKRIVELHSGRVGLVSKLGAGSCFSIDLPYTPSFPIAFEMVAGNKPPTATPELDSIPNSATAAQAPSILLAEDNKANIITISSYLEAKGYRVLLAQNGQEAIHIAKNHQPELILMDIQMPGMDGLKAIAQIRLDPNLVDIPIIALTALAMTGDREKCLEAGANDYLTKPVQLKQLTIAIQQSLARRNII